MTQDALPIWTIYDHPSDFPNGYVIRKSYSWSMVWPNGKRVPASCQRGGVVYDSLKLARHHCESLGATCIGRQPGDDPVIVECWI